MYELKEMSEKQSKLDTKLGRLEEQNRIIRAVIVLIDDLTPEELESRLYKEFMRIINNE